MSLGLVGRTPGKLGRIRTIGKSETQHVKKRQPFMLPVGMFNFADHLFGRLINFRLPKPLKTAQKIQRMFQRKTG